MAKKRKDVKDEPRVICSLCGMTFEALFLATGQGVGCASFPRVDANSCPVISSCYGSNHDTDVFARTGKTSLAIDDDEMSVICDRCVDGMLAKGEISLLKSIG